MKRVKSRSSMYCFSRAIGTPAVVRAAIKRRRDRTGAGPSDATEAVTRFVEDEDRSRQGDALDPTSLQGEVGDQLLRTGVRIEPAVRVQERDLGRVERGLPGVAPSVAAAPRCRDRPRRRSFPHQPRMNDLLVDELWRLRPSVDADPSGSASDLVGPSGAPVSW